MARESPELLCVTVVVVVALIKLPGIINASANVIKARTLSRQAEQKREKLAGRIMKAQNTSKEKKGG